MAQDNMPRLHWFAEEEPNNKVTLDKKNNPFYELFKATEVKSWFLALINYLNAQKRESIEISTLFNDWQTHTLQEGLDFFAREEWVNLVNTIFFYKLYPDKLFDTLIHPEKLVSVHLRLSILHYFIEELIIQLHAAAVQHGLKPEVDYLFHGDELPQGIMIEVDAKFREIIQSTLKQLKINYTAENEEQMMIDKLHDLGRAYKYWFNPNRLIDAVMVLQLRMINAPSTGISDSLRFRQAMLPLFGYLTTTECLNLYGYFTNNDSRYLLYTLFIITQNRSLSWLPVLKENEKNAIVRVFQSLQSVMEALREALQSRHITTEPYRYDLEKKNIQVGRRNRDAVFRIIQIYGEKNIIPNDKVEKLFNLIEDAGKKEE